MNTFFPLLSCHYFFNTFDSSQFVTPPPPLLLPQKMVMLVMDQLLIKMTPNLVYSLGCPKEMEFQSFVIFL